MCAGQIGAAFGASSLAFSGDEYKLRLTMQAPRIDATLTLRPVARPALTRSVPLGDSDPMQWFVLPCLEATGDVRIDGRRYRLDRSPAYHDHNWGRFSWGGDFAWEWAIALSAGPTAWSLIYYRITDRGRHNIVSQGLLIWGGGRHLRTFHDREIRARSTGLMRTSGCLRLPPIMRLAAAGSAADIPTRLAVSAAGSGDELDVTFELSDCAQICIPDDADEGITVISECHATATVSGRVQGCPVRFAGRSVVEFNRGSV
jgi:hypothetical protein